MSSKAPTTTSSTAAPAWLQQNLQDVQSRAQGVASTPYTPYTGQLTAGSNALLDQANAGLAGVASAGNAYTTLGSQQANAGYETTANAGQYYQQGAAGLGAAQPYFTQAASTINGAQPYYSQAANYTDKAAGPLDINSYLNPYQQSVIDATMAQQQRQDSIAQNGALSTAIQSGNAFGGDRAGVAAAQLASNQSLNRTSTLAGLNSANYTQALGAAQADAARYGNAATHMTGLGNAQLQAGQGYNTVGNSQVQAGLGYGQLGSGVTQQGTALTNEGTSQANIGSQYQNNALQAYLGQLQGGQAVQQNDQAGLNAAYQQYLNKTSFPYQQTSWLSNVINGGSGAAGGTTTSTGSAPSTASQITGGLAAAAALMAFNRGGVVPERAAGGAVQAGVGFPMAGGPIDMYSTPYTGGGLIPTITINPSRLNAPAAIDPNKGQGGSQDMSKGLAGLSNGWLGQSRPTYGGASSAMGDPTGIGGLYASGGVVPRGYADGGVPNFDDRWSPVNDALGDFTFQPGQVVSPGLVPQSSPQPAPQSSTPLGPTDPNAAPFRLDGSYRDQPENIAPLNETQAASRFAGNDEPVAGLGLPPEIARGMSRPVPQQDSPVMAYDAPRGLVPLSYAPLPTGVVPQSANGAPSDSLVGKLFGVGDDGRQAMLSLGLGLLANRSPNFGTALGEAGLGAAGTLNSIQAGRAKQAEKDRDYSMEVQKINQAAEQYAAQLRLTGSSQAETARHNKAVELKEFKPTFGIIGEDPTTGGKQYGWIDPNSRKVTGPTGDTPVSSGPSTNLVGDEYLATLSSDKQAIVKKLANYEIDPRSLSMKGGHREQLMAAASRVNPDFDAINYPARAATRKDFTSGKSAQNISSFNTAIGHLDTLDKAIDALGNTGSSWYNKISGVVSEQTDTKYQKSLKEFQTARTAVSDELTRAFRGSGGNVHDIKQWESAINTADSPQALHAATKQAMELLRSRIEAVGDQYNRGMNTSKEAVELLSPKAQSAISRLLGEGGQEKPATVKTSELPKTNVKTLDPVKVSTKDGYSALPSGAEFIGTDGKRYRKP
jgi:hypothetical protein